LPILISEALVVPIFAVDVFGAVTAAFVVEYESTSITPNSTSYCPYSSAFSPTAYWNLKYAVYSAAYWNLKYAVYSAAFNALTVRPRYGIYKPVAAGPVISGVTDPFKYTDAFLSASTVTFKE